MKELVGLIKSADNSSNFSSVANSVSIIFEPVSKLDFVRNAVPNHLWKPVIGLWTKGLDQQTVLLPQSLHPLLEQRNLPLQLRPSRFFLTLLI